MFLSLGLIILLALVFGPSLWVKFVMNRYSSNRPEMPGTGGELAQHLIDRFELKDVTVEVTELGDHYDSKSLTAVAIAAHEVGHAIQDQEGDQRLASRTKMVPIADKIGRWSAAIISLSPVIGIITRHPMPFSLVLLLGLSGFFARMMVHAVTLPIEFDASFSKALPVLSEGNYVSSRDKIAVTRILRAAALTYVSAALADVLNLGRWIAILLRR